MTLYKTFISESKAIDPGDGIYEAMISTESVDRDKDILVATGANTDDFMRNPVVLYAHDYSDLPVAKALEVKKIDGVGLLARFQFPPKGTSEKADTVHRLWAGGFLNATSVGFQPKQVEDLGNGGTRFKEWDLLEFSIVPVPANQDALRLAVKAMGDAGVEVPETATSDGLPKALYTTISEGGDVFVGGDFSEGDGHTTFKVYNRTTGDFTEFTFDPDTLTKRGRVLSARNEKRLRDAAAALADVLSELGETPEPDEESDGKTLAPVTDPNITDLSSSENSTHAARNEQEEKEIAEALTKYFEAFSSRRNANYDYAP